MKQLLLISLVLWQGSIYDAHSSWSDSQYRIVDVEKQGCLTVETLVSRTDSVGATTTSWEPVDSWFRDYVYATAIRELTKKK